MCCLRFVLRYHVGMTRFTQSAYLGYFLFSPVDKPPAKMARRNSAVPSRNIAQDRHPMPPPRGKRRANIGSRKTAAASLASLPDKCTVKVFSFLNNDDLYNASFVSHRWEALALNDELYKAQ